MSKHTLYAGTTVIQTKKVDNHDVWGLVKCTGFQTQKGSLVKDILFPKPFVFQFMRDVYKFIFLLGGISLIGFFGVLPGLLATLEDGLEVF
jgi:cation-transporting P-type ATPase 13A2